MPKTSVELIQYTMEKRPSDSEQIWMETCQTLQVTQEISLTTYSLGKITILPSLNQVKKMGMKFLITISIHLNLISLS